MKSIGEVWARFRNAWRRQKGVSAMEFDFFRGRFRQIIVDSTAFRLRLERKYLMDLRQMNDAQIGQLLQDVEMVLRNKTREDRRIEIRFDRAMRGFFRTPAIDIRRDQV